MIMIMIIIISSSTLHARLEYHEIIRRMAHARKSGHGNALFGQLTSMPSVRKALQRPASLLRPNATRRTQEFHKPALEGRKVPATPNSAIAALGARARSSSVRGSHNVGWDAFPYIGTHICLPSGGILEAS